MEVTHVMAPIWRSCRSWFLCGIGWALSCQSLIKTCPTDLPTAGLMEAFSPWRLPPLILQLVSSWHKSRQHKDITRFTPAVFSNIRKLAWSSPITGYRENVPCLPRALSTQPSTFIHLLSSYPEPVAVVPAPSQMLFLQRVGTEGRAFDHETCGSGECGWM